MPMKVYLFFLLLLNLGTIHSKLLTVTDYVPPSPPRRLAAFDPNQLKEALDTAIKRYGWTAEPTIPNTFTVKANIAGKRVIFFNVSLIDVKVGAAGTPTPFIVVSNLPNQLQDPTFARFHRHKIYSRQSPSQTPGVNDKFLERNADKFYQLYKTVLEHSAVPLMFSNVKKLITEQGSQDVMMIERGRSVNSMLFDLNSKSNGKLVAQAVVYSVSDDYVGLSLAHKDDVSYFNVPVANLEGSNADILRVMTDKAAKVETKMDLLEAKRKIEDKIRSLCSTNVPEIETLSATGSRLVIRLNRSGQTQSVTPDNICPFIDSDVFLSHFTHGYMQYFHLVFNSRFLREEYIMATPKDKFELNLEKAFQMIKSDTHLAHKILRDNKPEEELKLEDIKDVLEKGIGESAVDEPFTPAELASCDQSGNKCVAKYKFSAKEVDAQLYQSREGWIISATRMLPVIHAPMSIQLSTSLKSPGSQKPALLQHIQSFMSAN